MAITWRPVDSSNVAAIGWPKDAWDIPKSLSTPVKGRELLHVWRPPLLLVIFKDGRCYGYLGVSQQRSVYLATRCPSVGSYVNKQIKPNFKAVRVPELDRIQPKW